MIIVGNSSELNITHVGNTTKLGLKVKDILVVPNIKNNLPQLANLQKIIHVHLNFLNLILLLKTRSQGDPGQGM